MRMRVVFYGCRDFASLALAPYGMVFLSGILSVLELVRVFDAGAECISLYRCFFKRVSDIISTIPPSALICTSLRYSASAQGSSMRGLLCLDALLQDLDRVYAYPLVVRLLRGVDLNMASLSHIVLEYDIKIETLSQI